MYDLCVGLGYHCESTYQLRRHTGDERARFFDWLDLDFGSVVDTIRGDFQDVLRTGPVVPFSDGRCALDRPSNIRFFHDFHAEPGRPLAPPDIHRQLPRVREKFTYLAERWRAMTASSAHVLYVHHDAFDEIGASDVLRLRAVLAAQHPDHRFGLLWLRRTPPPDADGLPPGVRWDTVPLVEGRWEGDDLAWDRVLSALPLRRRATPAAKSRA
ncbi:papain-like cysteine peptidase [Actinomycetota bacterium Odt1-20B]